jgi:hypothetical protein
MNANLFKLCAAALVLSQIERGISAGAEFGPVSSTAFAEREKAANEQRDALKLRAQKVLVANKANLQRLPMPPTGFWLIDLSDGRANRESIQAVHSLLGDDAGWVRLTNNDLGSDEIKTVTKSRGIFQLDLSDTPIGDKDLVEIGSLINLVELSLRNYPVMLVLFFPR